MRPERSARNPFLGPVPFEREDADRFFGRGGEIQELVSLIVAHRVVVLYAASGAGKTSLLNAGVLPLLERRERFEVLPAARFSRVAADDEDARGADNVYVYTTLLNWSDPDDSDATAHTTLAAFLAAREPPHDPRGRRLSRVVVFDQFEEIFTMHPEYWEQREGLFEQLAAALDEDRHLHVVLTLREDYLAQLEPLLPQLLTPGEEEVAEGEEELDLRVPVLRSHVRYRLERLGRDAAIEAVIGPVEQAGRTFRPGVAEGLVENLQKLRVDVGLAEPLETPGEFVEPVQLQVVCHSLWNDLPHDVEEITKKHIQAFGDVDEVLERFYDEAANAAAKAAHVSEERLRKWLEEAFITSLGTRNMIYRAVDSKARFPDAAIDELEDRHVIRGDWRAGTRWYELTHDRFIAPVQSSNARVAAEHSRQRRKRARTFALVALPVVALVAAWGAWTREEATTSTQIGAVSEVSRLQLDLPFEAYDGPPPSGPEIDPSRHGNLFEVLITSQGYDSLVLRARTVDENGRVADPAATRVAIGPPPDEAPTATHQLWVALPARPGRFAYMVSLEDPEVSLEDPESEAVLGERQSEFFKMLPNGVVLNDKASFVLQIRKRGRGKGTVESVPQRIDCGRVCSFKYEGGTRVSLVARPGPSSAFGRWLGDCKGKGKGSTCAVTVERATTVVVEFTSPPRDIVTTRTGNGVQYRRSPELADKVLDIRGPDDNAAVVIYCYTKGEVAHSVIGRDRWQSTDWAKVVLKPIRYVPAAYLRRSRVARIAGVPNC